MSKNKSLFSSIDFFLHEGFANEESKLYRIINDFIVFLIFISILSITLESVTSLNEKYQYYFKLSENIIVAIFTLEYIINIYVAKEKRKYMLGPWGFIDLFAILPSYLNFIDLRALKVVRVGRVLRFLRLMRMARLLKLSKNAVAQYDLSKKVKINTLKMDLQIYFIALFSVLIIFSTLIYYAERNVPDTAYTSIPQAMWWCIVTITTVGYGDMYPATVIGKMIAAVTMLTGLALFGMLMNVIGKSMMTSLFGSANLEDVENQVKEIGGKKGKS